MTSEAELERYANHRGYPEELPNFGPVAAWALAEIRKLRAAVKPFADISGLVEHTDKRDGERVFELPKPDGGYWTLVREDFRRAGRAVRP